MRLDQLQDTLLSRLYDEWFKPRREHVIAEDVAEEFGSARELGSRAAAELVDAEPAISPVIGRGTNKMTITVAGILDAERRGIGTAATRERQQTLRKRVVQAFLREREANGPNPIDATAIRRELNYSEEEFLANVDVLVAQGLIARYGGSNFMFTVPRRAQG